MNKYLDWIEKTAAAKHVNAYLSRDGNWGKDFKAPYKHGNMVGENKTGKSYAGDEVAESTRKSRISQAANLRSKTLAGKSEVFSHRLELGAEKSINGTARFVANHKGKLGAAALAVGTGVAAYKMGKNSEG